MSALVLAAVTGPNILPEQKYVFWCLLTFKRCIIHDCMVYHRVAAGDSIYTCLRNFNCLFTLFILYLSSCFLNDNAKAAYWFEVMQALKQYCIYYICVCIYNICTCIQVLVYGFWLICTVRRRNIFFFVCQNEIKCKLKDVIHVYICAMWNLTDAKNFIISTNHTRLLN